MEDHSEVCREVKGPQKGGGRWKRKEGKWREAGSREWLPHILGRAPLAQTLQGYHTKLRPNFTGQLFPFFPLCLAASAPCFHA